MNISFAQNNNAQAYEYNASSPLIILEAIILSFSNSKQNSFKDELLTALYALSTKTSLDINSQG